MPEEVMTKEEVKEKKKEIVETKEKKEQEKPKEKEGKKEVKNIVKKEEAIARGLNLRISKKQSIYICDAIKNKKIGEAINYLEDVKKFKRAVPFRGEIPHRKGMMSGRYPIKAAGLFVNVLKGLMGNVIINGLDLDKTVIYSASATWSSRPMRSRRRLGKRTNVILKAREVALAKK